MGPRLALLFGTSFAGGCLAALALWATPVGAFGGTSDPCSLISKAQIKKDLGLAHIKETPVIGNQNPSDGGVVASSCKNIFVWSGSVPTTPKQFAAKLANGTGALLHIRTFVADPSATNASDWTTNGFQTMLSASIGACSAYTHLPHGRTVALPRHGAQNSAGYAGAGGAGGKDQLNVCGVWDRYDSHRIIVIILETSQHKPTVKRFKKVTKTAVPSFW
jgi:hypothetical protein